MTQVTFENFKNFLRIFDLPGTSSGSTIDNNNLLQYVERR